MKFCAEQNIVSSGYCRTLYLQGAAERCIFRLLQNVVSSGYCRTSYLQGTADALRFFPYFWHNS